MENLHYNRMMIEATADNWREISESIIGTEPVTFGMFAMSYPRPIIKIASSDKSALSRVLDRAIEYASVPV